MSDIIFLERQRSLALLLSRCQSFVASLQKDHCNDKYPIIFPKRDMIEDLKPRSHSRSSASRQSQDYRVLGFSDELRIHCHDLDEGSLAKLLSSRLVDCLSFLERLHQRILDPRSRMLITGDLNAGKSTFANALLRQELLPSDEQPCTQSFCEVFYTSNSQSTIEAYYDFEPADKFDTMEMEDMQKMIQDEESPYRVFKVMLPRGSSPSILLDASLIDISIIDSPGLNSDLFKTMSLFSKQDDIDVIVFVINASNHMTLSAREFLETASKEKSYVFIVVNKFEDIKNKEKCQRIIMSQIQEVLPKTYEDRDELVHFISARDFLCKNSLSGNDRNEIDLNPIHSNFNGKPSFIAVDSPNLEQNFLHLEKCLKAFILEKRTKSKLLPAKTYLSNLLEELSSILEYNHSKRKQDAIRVKQELEIISPCFDELVAHNGLIHADLKKISEDIVEDVRINCLSQWQQYTPASIIDRIPWLGILGVFSFRDRVAFLMSRERDNIFSTIKMASIDITVKGLEKMNSTARFHAKEVFHGLDGDSVPSREKICEAYNAEELSLIDTPSLGVWDLVDFSSLHRGSSWMSAAMIAGTTLGYQHIISLALRLLDLSRDSRRFLGVAVIFGVGALATSLLLSDFEQMVRQHLSQHYLGVFKSASLQMDCCRALETTSLQLATMRQTDLITRFDSALHQQRELRAERELKRCQIEAQLNHMGQQLTQARGLLSSLKALNLE